MTEDRAGAPGKACILLGRAGGAPSFSRSPAGSLLASCRSVALSHEESTWDSSPATYHCSETKTFDALVELSDRHAHRSSPFISLLRG
jgi:hypothetical protein